VDIQQADTRFEDRGTVKVDLSVFEVLEKRTSWLLEKFSEEDCVYARKVLGLFEDAPVSREHFLRLAIEPVEVIEVQGNLFLNEGLQLMGDLIIGASTNSWNAANAFIGVGDTNTAEAASQTELQATQNAANRFYKAVNGTPTRSSQTVTWAADFTSSEANFAWAEFTVARGATTASGSGFLVGTTNLNRKVQSLGTKVTGTWTLTVNITLA
jgi:hypothetical protein